MCAFLAERAAEMVSSATVEVACCAIGHRHRSLRLPDPMIDPRVRQVRRGLRRLLGPQPRRIARPLDVSDLRRLLTAVDRDTTMGIRDAAIILLEFAHGRGAATDPVAALDSWLRRRGIGAGPLFTSMAGGADRTGEVTLVPISGTAIARMLRKRALAAGLPAERVTGHSLGAGHATTAALAGVSIDSIAAQTRHKKISILLERYIRPADALRHTSSKDLGL